MEEEQKPYRTHEQEWNAFNSKIKVDRPKEWETLNIKEIEEELGALSPFEYKMVMNTCKDKEMAIKAVKNSRKANEDFSLFMKHIKHEESVERYRRSHYNDLEEDNEENSK